MIAEYVKFSQSRSVAQEVLSILLMPIIQLRKRLLDFKYDTCNLFEIVTVNKKTQEHKCDNKVLTTRNWQRLLGTYLSFLIELLKVTHSESSIKLLSEMFIGDKDWTDLILVLLTHSFSYILLSLHNNIKETKDYIIEVINTSINGICYLINSLELLERLLNQGKEMKSYSRWLNNLKYLLEELAKLFYPINGLLSRYLTLNENTGMLDPYITHALTKSVLRLTEEFLVLSNKHTKLLTRDWALFFIRTHYMSFVKMYTKDIKDKKCQNELAKCHLRCLWAIATNRNEELSKDFFKMNCVSFLIKEIDLEYELSPGGDLYEEKNSENSIHSNKLKSPSKFHSKALKLNKKHKEDRLHPKSKLMNYDKLITNEQISTEEKPTEKITSKPDYKSTKPHLIEGSDSQTTLFPSITNKKPQFTIENTRTLKNIGQSFNMHDRKKSQKDFTETNLDLYYDSKTTMSRLSKQKILDNFSAQTREESKELCSSNSQVLTKPECIIPLQNNKEIKTNPTVKFFSPTRNIIHPVVININDVKNVRPINVVYHKKQQSLDNSKNVMSGKLKIPDKTWKKKNVGEIPFNFLVVNSCSKTPVNLKKKAHHNKLNSIVLLKNSEIIKDNSTKDDSNTPINKIKNNTIVDIIKKDIDNPIIFPNIEDDKKAETKLSSNSIIHSVRMPRRPAIPRLSFQSLSKFTSESSDELNNSKELAKSSINVGGQPRGLVRQKSIFELGTENKSQLFLSHRKNREIYKDDELHALMVGFLMSLLITPSNGTLDDLYCSLRPYDENKVNVLHLLHHHINHPLNTPILSSLSFLVCKITPALSGLRLLKLLCKTFFEPSLYSGWQKIATGAYATVFDCETQLTNPKSVAIKRLGFPRMIYEHCILYDAFNEITVLEKFHNKNCITTLYDYGVDDQNYYLVMKKYTTNLREWRISQTGSMKEQLPLYLELYMKVLKAVEVIHSHGVSHYDLKCDNFMLEKDNNDFNVSLGDFGVAKIFLTDKDEKNFKPRGTECIKSPEMLKLSSNHKTDIPKDQREATTKSSDIWSLGCLFYELVTGNYLFTTDDYISFYLNLTDNKMELLNESNIKALEGDMRLVNFLRFMLNRIANDRPSISLIIDTFQQVKDSMVKVNVNVGNCSGNMILEDCLEMCKDITKMSIAMRMENNFDSVPSLIKVLKNVYLCTSQDYLTKNLIEVIHNYSVTHIVMENEVKVLQSYFEIYAINNKLQKEVLRNSINIYNELPGIMDFCRKAIFHNGILLFVNDPNNNIKIALIAIISYLLKTNQYETWTLLNNQSLSMSLQISDLILLNQWVSLTFQVNSYINNYPRYSCLCGCCTFILKSNTRKICSCNCQTHTEVTCNKHLQYLREQHKVEWKKLIWGLFNKENIVAGSLNTGDLELNKIVLRSNGSTCVNKRNFKCASIPINEKWMLYECSYCHMWTHAISEGRILLVLNNALGNTKGILDTCDDAVILSEHKLSLTL